MCGHLKTDNLIHIKSHFNHYTWCIQGKCISNVGKMHTNNSKYLIKLFPTKLGPMSTVTCT